MRVVARELRNEFYCGITESMIQVKERGTRLTCSTGRMWILPFLDLIATHAFREDLSGAL